MIELYVHTVYFNGANLSFDRDEPVDFPAEGLCVLVATNGDRNIINMKHVQSITIKHLTLTEEEYENRRKLLNHEE